MWKRYEAGSPDAPAGGRARVLWAAEPSWSAGAGKSPLLGWQVLYECWGHLCEDVWMGVERDQSPMADRERARVT